MEKTKGSTSDEHVFTLIKNSPGSVLIGIAKLGAIPKSTNQVNGSLCVERTLAVVCVKVRLGHTRGQTGQGHVIANCDVKINTML